MKYKYFVSYWYSTENAGVFVGSCYITAEYNLDDYEEGKANIDAMQENIKEQVKALKVVIQSWKTF